LYWYTVAGQFEITVVSTPGIQVLSYNNNAPGYVYPGIFEDHCASPKNSIRRGLLKQLLILRLLLIRG